MSAGTIADYLESDHRRLDGLLAETVDALAAGSMAQAARAFAQFQEGIERHIGLEEQLLLPHFDEATGPSGPAQAMREEHGRILNGVCNIALWLHSNDRARCFEELDSLATLLSTHNLKEERVLYPVAERILASLGQRDDILARMQEMVLNEAE